MSEIKGIDVSQHQGGIDFNKVKQAGIKYVIIRAGYGRYVSQVDPYFESNYAKAKAAGLGVGVYWYSYAASIDDAKAEAKACLEVIKGKQFDYPIYFDLEERSQFDRGMKFCTNLVTAFCDTLEKAGYFAGLYISRSPLQEYIEPSIRKRYALWVAEYGSKLNYPVNQVGMWQYSSTGNVLGIIGSVDMDICYVDYPTIIKENGLNGYPAPAKGDKILDSTGAKPGDRTLAVYAYKSLLRIAKEKGIIKISVDDNNVYGSGTLQATNELLKKYGYDPTGIVGENLIKRLTDDIRKG